jgi:hypothetical protein
VIDADDVLKGVSWCSFGIVPSAYRYRSKFCFGSANLPGDVLNHSRCILYQILVLNCSGCMVNRLTIGIVLLREALSTLAAFSHDVRSRCMSSVGALATSKLLTKGTSIHRGVMVGNHVLVDVFCHCL